MSLLAETSADAETLSTTTGLTDEGLGIVTDGGKLVTNHGTLSSQELRRLREHDPMLQAIPAISLTCILVWC